MLRATGDAHLAHVTFIDEEDLTLVFCNDRARRKIIDAIKELLNRDRTKTWAAAKGVTFYTLRYKNEKKSKDYSPAMHLQHRQRHAVPVWEQVVGWARKIVDEGLAHGSLSGALQYLLKRAEGLRRYCDDRRLPISNILAEHVGKKVAIARKNFLVADTPTGAMSTAMSYSLIGTAQANGHNAHQYLAVVPSALPSARSRDDFEALLPWTLSPD